MGLLRFLFNIITGFGKESHREQETAFDIGELGERKTTLHIRKSLDANIYRRFHNVIIPSKNGTTQIDHLLVSPYGLFIIETKNIKGWIFGSKDQPEWMQSLYKKKYFFQNPIRQTFRQRKILSEYLGINKRIIHTVIYFVGDCEFKTELPANVIKSELGEYIKQFHNRIVSPGNINRIFRVLEQHVSESSLTSKDHVRSLRERHTSNTRCPKCGSNLVQRTVKKGSTAGATFLGCENYPQCRFTKNA